MPGMEAGIHDLDVLLRSRVPIILVETSDERRALETFKRLALRNGTPVMRWSVTTGLYLLLDFHPYLDDPAHVRMIREIAMGYGAALDNTHLLAELTQTRPLSVVMAERLRELREWVRNRTVSAN